MVATRILSALTPSKQTSASSLAPGGSASQQRRGGGGGPPDGASAALGGGLPRTDGAPIPASASAAALSAQRGQPQQEAVKGDDYWTTARNYATDSYHEATSHLTSIVSTLYGAGIGDGAARPNMPSSAADLGDNGEGGQLIAPAAHVDSATGTAVVGSSSTFPSWRPSSVELNWLRLQNPYNSVMGRHENPSSLSAVRSLLTLVPTDDTDGSSGESTQHQHLHKSRSSSVRFLEDEIGQPVLERIPSAGSDDNSSHPPLALSGSLLSVGSGEGGGYSGRHASHGGGRRQVSDAETASRLAEGTIRALRDLALDEAIELHAALRFWTERWERPLLSWLEAGPTVWLSESGYEHQFVGKRVAQIQAVLARRCASIGQLQEHLLRAGWQRGVEQWGVLGQGGQWATVAGGDGVIDDQSGDVGGGGGGLGIGGEPSLSRESSAADANKSDSGARTYSTDSIDAMRILPRTMLSSRYSRDSTRSSSGYYGEAAFKVEHTRGGKIVYDDPALAAWTVDAIRVVRDQLYRAANGQVTLPFFEHWEEEALHFRGEGSGNAPHDPSSTPITLNIPNKTLPIWATEDVFSSAPATPRLDDGQDDDMPTFDDTLNDDYDQVHSGTEPLIIDANVDEGDHTALSKATNRDDDGINGDIIISDLPLFAAEVSALLDSMEEQMKNQRMRRLERLKPPSRLVRNWYIAAIGAPVVGFVGYRMFKDGAVRQLWKQAIEKIGAFYAEHISGPVQSIYGELFKGRPDVTDRKARLEAIETLKSMLGSWLDDSFPDMSEEEKISRADSMDVSLVEKCKEESIKHIYNVNEIVRLSMIEMQFIKKELMSAMVSMDELMGSNEVNMQIAAMTPAFILLYGVRHVFRWCFYALLKVGKSREETFASFRHIILDIERLLVMRDNPPSAPKPLAWGTTGHAQSSPRKQFAAAKNEGMGIELDNSYQRGKDCVLNANDLGMLMLLVHECRMILWSDSRRFNSHVIRNVLEDLSELAGERGPVSVQQQLSIIARMVRTYSFLKVVSTGLPFELIRTA